MGRFSMCFCFVLYFRMLQTTKKRDTRTYVQKKKRVKYNFITHFMLIHPKKHTHTPFKIIFGDTHTKHTTSALWCFGWFGGTVGWNGMILHSFFWAL